MIRFVIKNNTTKLSGDIGVLNKLFKHLKFKHPNAYWIQKKTNYTFDGFVYPLSKAGNMKTGLLEKALEFLSDYEEDYELIDHRSIPEVGTVPSVVAGIKLYPIQFEAIQACVHNTFLGEPHPRGIIATAVNSGKTLMMFGIHLSYVGAKTILLINNSALFNQMKRDLEDAFPDDWGWLQGKKVKWGNIMVVMVQSLKNRLTEYSDKLLDFNILLTDEGDLADNATFDYVYKKLHHISVRFAFTGTVFLRSLKKDQLRNIHMREIFGEALYTIYSKELEDMGISTRTIIKIVKGNRVPVRGIDLKDEIDTVMIHSKKRNKKIFKRVLFNLRCGRRNMMVFCKYIEQTELLYEYLKKKLPEKYTIDYTHHKRYKELGPNSLDDFRDGKVNILVTSLYLKRGMNFPLVKCIINTAGGEFYTGPLQVMGRGVRKHKTKDKWFYEDIYDEGHYLGRHSKQRLSYYEKVGYTVRFIN